MNRDRPPRDIREWIGPIVITIVLIALAALFWASQRRALDTQPPASPRPTATAQPAPTAYLDDDEDADEGPTPVPDDPIEIEEAPGIDFDD